MGSFLDSNFSLDVVTRSPWDQIRQTKTGRTAWPGLPTWILLSRGAL